MSNIRYSILDSNRCGIVSDVIVEHSVKQSSPISLTLNGTDTVVSDAQLQKHFSPITLIDDGIDIDDRDEQS